MESRIEKELKGRTPKEVTKLNLNGCKCTEISGLTADYTNLTSLSLVNAGLTSLKGFPGLPNLRKLDLADNRLSGGLEALQNCPKITYLILSGNQIKDIETLEPLKSLKELQSLDLCNCEVSNTDGFKEKVFELLEGLLYLDGFDKNGEEADLQDGDDFSDDDDEEEDDEEDDVGLEYLQKPGLEDESEGEDFAPGDDDGDDVDEDESEEDTERGVKRKHADEEDEESGQ